MMPCCWGIFRERQHSPGREFDDTEILRLVAKHLEATGYRVILKTPEDLGGGDEPLPVLVFLMCERTDALAFLETLKAKGIPHVNPLQAVLNTYRDRMIRLLVAAAVPIPESHIVPSDPSGLDQNVTLLGTYRFPAWVKRGDVHNTGDGDVEFVRSPEQLREAVAALHGRGIPRVVLQRHVVGDLIKFYGVGRPRRGDRRGVWFRWFYHREQQLARHPFSEKALQTLAGRAALALGLEIYGGDAIVTSGGEIFLIDINAWPSFALYREEASYQIAQWLLRLLTDRTSR